MKYSLLLTFFKLHTLRNPQSTRNKATLAYLKVVRQNTLLKINNTFYKLHVSE